MKSLVRFLLLSMASAAVVSCSDVAFRSEKGSAGLSDCGTNCPQGSYQWVESGFNQCSKPCGGGTQTQTVECKRTSDDAVVPDNLCSPPKPATTKDCNVPACTSTYTWNVGNYGNCSKECGGGTKTRPVVCQNESGVTVADTNCAAPKPSTSATCNTNACPTFSWDIGNWSTCSVTCGGGTRTRTVVCKNQSGQTVADSNCPAPKPATSGDCNTDACTHTYMWEPGAWSTCSKTCGPGTQTRPIFCKRDDGAFVAENMCNAATKPANSQNCQIATCPTGREVTQIEYVSPAQNALDVILIIDDSASMKADQAKLAQRMSGLLADLDALKIDYQVCLTTTDIRYYLGSPIKWNGLNSFVMTKNSPNKNQVFLTTIDALGAEWSSDEQGIKATYLMLKDFRNLGCVREQATLTTILVSDENERSVGGNKSWSSAQYEPLTPQNYPDHLINYIKSEFDTATFKKTFIWNSIIVKPGDKVCEAAQDAQTSPSFFGTLYAELSTKTGGYIGSICDNDYAQNLKYIKEKTVNKMPGLTLECTPIGTPVVTFDQAVSTSISVVGNQLKFTPAVPEGVKVTVKYTCPN